MKTYKGLDIFLKKRPEVSSRSNLIFAVLVLNSFKVQFMSLDRWKANSTFEQHKCKGHKKRDQILISKVSFVFQISQRNKTLPFDPVFSN